MIPKHTASPDQNQGYNEKSQICSLALLSEIGYLSQRGLVHLTFTPCPIPTRSPHNHTFLGKSAKECGMAVFLHSSFGCGATLWHYYWAFEILPLFDWYAFLCPDSTYWREHVGSKIPTCLGKGRKKGISV